MIILERPWRVHSDEFKRDALDSYGHISFHGGSLAVKENERWIVVGSLADLSIATFIDDAIAQGYQVSFRQKDTEPPPRDTREQGLR